MKVWLPYPLWDIQGIETWLNDLAAKGYELKRFSRFWSIGRVEFQPSEQAKQCRYRLDPIGKWAQSFEVRDRAANYRELGWHFVENIGNLYALYRCGDPDAPDLYTDRESLGWAMKRLIRRQWLGLAAILALALWSLRDLLSQLFTTPAVPAMNLILDFERLAPLYLALVVLLGGSVLGNLYQTARFIQLRRLLAQGELPPRARRTYPQLQEALSVLLLIVFLVGYFFFFTWVSGWREQRLSENPAEWDFPHVALSEILPAGTELREENPLEKLHYNTFTRSWLAPEQYDTVQTGLARLPGEISRQVLLALDYMETRSPSLAEWVYAGKVQEWRQELETPSLFEYVTEESVSYPGLDALTCFSYQYQDEDWPRACYVGRLGRQVFVLNLRGPELERPLDLLAERLTAQNEPD